MKQRVKIQYTIDLDELPLEVNNLLNKSNHRLIDQVESLEAAHRNGLDFIMTMKTVEDISAIREHLADIDFILSDVSTLITNYVSYKVQQDSQPPQQQYPQSQNNDEESS